MMFLLLLLPLLLNNCEAGFQSRWHGYIASLLRQHAQFPYAPVVIAAPLPPAYTELLTTRCYYLGSSSDPRVSAKFSDKTWIPFILLHRCGWTWDLSELSFTLAAQGLSFSDVEALLYEHIQERYYRTQIVFLFKLSHKLLPQHSSCTPAITSLPHCMLQSVSNDEIMYAFISRFNEVKGFFGWTDALSYRRAMQLSSYL